MDCTEKASHNDQTSTNSAPAGKGQGKMTNEDVDIVHFQDVVATPHASAQASTSGETNSEEASKQNGEATAGLHHEHAIDIDGEVEEEKSRDQERNIADKSNSTSAASVSLETRREGEEESDEIESKSREPEEGNATLPSDKSAAAANEWMKLRNLSQFTVENIEKAAARKRQYENGEMCKMDCNRL